jgi:hypothetical protein
MITVQRIAREWLWFIGVSLGVGVIIVAANTYVCWSAHGNCREPSFSGPILIVYVFIILGRVTIWAIRTVRK